MAEKKDKLLVRKATLSLRRKYGRVKSITICERDAFVPLSVENDIRETVQKRKTTTATDIALKYDIRVSTIKLLLKQYAEEGLIKLLDPSLKLKIYIPAS